MFTSMRTALVLILVPGGARAHRDAPRPGAVGPSGRRAGLRRWLETVRPKYGGWTGVMDTLQLFAIFSSIWFKGVIVLLTTSILACSVNRFRGLWKTAIRPRTKMTATFYDRAPHSASVAVATDADVARGVQSPGLRGAPLPDRHRRRRRRRPHLRRPLPLGAIRHPDGAHQPGADPGRRARRLHVRASATRTSRRRSGRRWTSATAPGMSVMAKSFTDTYNTENGSPERLRQRPRPLHGTAAGRRARRSGSTSRCSYGGITFYQSFFGPAADDAGHGRVRQGRLRRGRAARVGLQRRQASASASSPCRTPT